MTLPLDHLETLAWEATSLADEVLRIVHAFPDQGRKDDVRALARRVAEVEAEVRRLREAVRGAVPRLEAAMERLGGNGENPIVAERVADDLDDLRCDLFALRGEP